MSGNLESDWDRETKFEESCTDYFDAVSECPNYLWHTVLDIIYYVALIMDYKPPEPQTSHTGPHYLCSLWSCLSLSLLLSFIQTGQMVKYVTIRVTGAVNICWWYTSVIHLIFLLFFMPVMKLTSHHCAVCLTHSLSFAVTSWGLWSQEPGKDLSVGLTAKTCTQAELWMIYRAYFWEW